jgi:diadenylate cyclase
VLQNILNFWRTFLSYHWWQVGVELLLIGSLVYWLVNFLQGTRGARMLRGIATVLIYMYVVVRLLGPPLGLVQIEWLFTERFLPAASLATIIVFQPELRRALMRLGESGFFRNWSQQINEDIDALVESATFLSHRKIGGLIAIEREVGLGGIAESGTRINADLSADLLNTIFWPNSPLHDLGVVVSHGRIMYAGVQFPLAESGELERELGSRHRAAVGMSQESDAIIIVVSEETGDISVAESGKLIRKLTPDALRGLIGELIGRVEPTAPGAGLAMTR